MIAVVCFLLLLGVMVIVLYIRNQRLEAIQRRQRRLEGAQMRIRKLKQDIEESNRQLELLKASLEKKRRETENLAGEIERYEKEQSHSTQLLEEKVRQNAQLIQLLHQSEIAKDTDGIIAKLKKASVGQYRLEDAEWNVFMKAVDEKFPSFSFMQWDDCGYLFINRYRRRLQRRSPPFFLPAVGALGLCSCCQTGAPLQLDISSRHLQHHPQKTPILSDFAPKNVSTCFTATQ